jgi:rare lipoprotein A (peptidoglycan hydrolase)
MASDRISITSKIQFSPKYLKNDPGAVFGVGQSSRSNSLNSQAKGIGVTGVTSKSAQDLLFDASKKIGDKASTTGVIGINDKVTTHNLVGINGQSTGSKVDSFLDGLNNFVPINRVEGKIAIKDSSSPIPIGQQEGGTRKEQIEKAYISTFVSPKQEKAAKELSDKQEKLDSRDIPTPVGKNAITPQAQINLEQNSIQSQVSSQTVPIAIDQNANKPIIENTAKDQSKAIQLKHVSTLEINKALKVQRPFVHNYRCDVKLEQGYMLPQEDGYTYEFYVKVDPDESEVYDYLLKHLEAINKRKWFKFYIPDGNTYRIPNEINLIHRNPPIKFEDSLNNNEKELYFYFRLNVGNPNIIPKKLEFYDTTAKIGTPDAQKYVIRNITVFYKKEDGKYFYSESEYSEYKNKKNAGSQEAQVSTATPYEGSLSDTNPVESKKAEVAKIASEIRSSELNEAPQVKQEVIGVDGGHEKTTQTPKPDQTTSQNPLGEHKFKAKLTPSISVAEAGIGIAVGVGALAVGSTINAPKAVGSSDRKIEGLNENAASTDNITSFNKRRLDNQSGTANNIVPFGNETGNRSIGQYGGFDTGSGTSQTFVAGSTGGIGGDEMVLVSAGMGEPQNDIENYSFPGFQLPDTGLDIEYTNDLGTQTIAGGFITASDLANRQRLAGPARGSGSFGSGGRISSGSKSGDGGKPPRPRGGTGGNTFGSGGNNGNKPPRKPGAGGLADNPKDPQDPLDPDFYSSGIGFGSSDLDGDLEFRQDGEPVDDGQAETNLDELNSPIDKFARIQPYGFPNDMRTSGRGFGGSNLKNTSKIRTTGLQNIKERVGRMTPNVAGNYRDAINKSKKTANAAVNKFADEIKKKIATQVIAFVGGLLANPITWIILAALFLGLVIVGGVYAAECRPKDELLTLRDKVVEPAAWGLQISTGEVSIIEKVGLVANAAGTILNPGSWYDVFTGKSVGLLPPTGLRKLIESLPGCSDLNANPCGPSAGSSGVSSGPINGCFDKTIFEKPVAEFIKAQGLVKYVAKTSKIKEIYDVGKQAGVPDEVIKWVIALSPTESDMSWDQYGSAEDCYGIIQFCRSKNGSCTFQNALYNVDKYHGTDQVKDLEQDVACGATASPSMSKSGNEIKGDKVLQMKMAWAGFKLKRAIIKNDCKLWPGESEIYRISAAWLGCSRRTDIGGTSPVNYGKAAENNYNVITCKDVATADSTTPKTSYLNFQQQEKTNNYWSEVFGFPVIARVNEYSGKQNFTGVKSVDDTIYAFNKIMNGKISVEAKVGSAVGNTKIDSAMIDELRKSEASGKIKWIQTKAGDALGPANEAAAGRLNIAAVKLILEMTKITDSVEITGLNDGGHADDSNHYKGLSVDVDSITVSGKTYRWPSGDGNTGVYDGATGSEAAINFADTLNKTGLVKKVLSWEPLVSRLKSKGINAFQVENHRNHYHIDVNQDGESTGIANAPVICDCSKNNDGIELQSNITAGPSSKTIEEAVKKYGGHSAIVQEIETGKVEHYNADQAPASVASTIKSVVTVVVIEEQLKKLAASGVTVDTEILVPSRLLGGEKINSKITIKEAIIKMLSNSSNATTNALVYYFGGGNQTVYEDTNAPKEKFTALMNEYGFPSMRFSKYINVTNPAGKNDGLGTENEQSTKVEPNKGTALDVTKATYKVFKDEAKYKIAADALKNADDYFKIGEIATSQGVKNFANKWGGTSKVVANIGAFEINDKKYIIGAYVNGANSESMSAPAPSKLRNIVKDLIGLVKEKKVLTRAGFNLQNIFGSIKADAAGAPSSYSSLSKDHKKLLEEVATAIKMGPVAEAGGDKPEMLAAFEKLKADAAKNTPSFTLLKKSGYRSHDTQVVTFFQNGETDKITEFYTDGMSAVARERVKAGYIKRSESSHPPGFSEHHSGLGIDIVASNRPASGSLSRSTYPTDLADYLATNAPKFGFELSFGKDSGGANGGAKYEPWHFYFGKSPSKSAGASISADQTGECPCPDDTPAATPTAPTSTSSSSSSSSKPAFLDIVFGSIKVSALANQTPSVGIVQEGVATEYFPGGGGIEGGTKDSQGKVIDLKGYSGAHMTYKYGTKVKVTNKLNGKSVIVLINDTGAFGPGTSYNGTPNKTYKDSIGKDVTGGNRLIDLISNASRAIGATKDSETPVKIEVVSPDAVPGSTEGGYNTSDPRKNCNNGLADAGFVTIANKIATVYNRKCGETIDSSKIIGKPGASWSTPNPRGNGSGCCYAAVKAALIINAFGNPTSPWAKVWEKIRPTIEKSEYAVSAYQFHNAMQSTGSSGKKLYEEAGLTFTTDPKKAPNGAIVVVDDISKPHGDINIKVADGKFVNYAEMTFMKDRTTALGVYFPK